MLLPPGTLIAYEVRGSCNQMGNCWGFPKKDGAFTRICTTLYLGCRLLLYANVL